MELYINNKKIEINDTITVEGINETLNSQTFTIKCDKRNSDIKFYLTEVIRRSEQFVCPSCDSQIIVSDERHNIKMCGVCKEKWAN